MKIILPLFVLLFLGFSLQGQTPGETLEGSVSYKTSQNVYVKFQSTESILVGDTLFVVQDAKMIPVLIVKDLSSISCVCTPISTKQLAVSDKISAKQKKIVHPKSQLVIAPVPILKSEVTKADSVEVKKEQSSEPKQNINGRISVSSYSNFSNISDVSQRLKYTFSLNAVNIGNSKLSAETYISFTHKLNEWSEVQDNIYNGLKVYSLSMNYAFNKNNSIVLGRKINPMLSSVGAIDGMQYDTKLKSLRAGIFAGTRPDYMDYSFNADLFQFGGYFGHDYSNKNGNMQSSIAYIEQRNNGSIDRRFMYLQHSNALIPNLFFFGSVEFDLYNMEMNDQDSTLTQEKKPKLSNTYVSLRYKVIKQLSVSLSYSARQNIIYYETYKNIIEQVLEAATLQGYMFQVSYRPGRNISIGANVGYRFSKQDPRPTKNLYTYFTYNNVPWIKASATLSATFLETSYLTGSIYSIGLSRDLVPGKLTGGLGYRYVYYNFANSEPSLPQNMGETNLTWRIMKKLSCSINYEGTFQKDVNYTRIYVNVTQRF
jgi:hypothetical protein